jgi:hypothetical protein
LQGTSGVVAHVRHPTQFNSLIKARAMEDDAQNQMADEKMSSSSDSDDGDVLGNVSEADLNLIMKLEGQLERNPNLYDAHVQLIEVLRRCGMQERLGDARRAMHARFPLTEALWFDWVADELAAVEGPEDVPRIAAMFEDAVKDYLSIGLWCQYLE